MSIRRTGDEHLWPNGVVPFSIEAVDFPLTSPGRSAILRAIDEWNTRTNITFVPRTSESDFVHFRMGDAETSLDSKVGRSGGRQNINGASLGFTNASVIHEIGHAVGLFHEQSREDRDRFVSINTGNVIADMVHNFKKHDTDGDDIGPYDYLSIMHYGRKFFASNQFADTIIPISWFGSETQGAGIAVADVTGDAVADDAVIFHIDDAPDGNVGYYRVAFGLRPDGTDSGISDLMEVPGWFGSVNHGGGIAIADISGSGRPDLLVFFVDHAEGGNRGYYRIGWDLDPRGRASSWSDLFGVDGWFGDETACASVALARISSPRNWDLVFFHVDNPSGANTGYFRVGMGLSTTGTVAQWVPPVAIPGWWGDSTAGGGVAVGAIGGSTTIVVFHIDDAAGGNNGFVRAAPLGRNGAAVNWTAPVTIGGWFGDSNQGGDVSLIDIGGNPALVLLHIDNPGGENRGFLRIGTNLTTAVDTIVWTGPVPVHNFGQDAINDIGNQSVLSALDVNAINQIYPHKSVFGPVVKAGGWFGSETQGADVAIASINGGPQPDMVMFFVDNPSGANTGYYRIGWDLDAFGVAAGGFSSAVPIPGWWGDSTSGGGVALADLSANGMPDLVVMHIDNADGGNKAYFRIGSDVNMTGMVTGMWTPHLQIPGWFGDNTAGAAIALADITRNGTQDLVVLHIDDVDGGNRGYYRVGSDLDVNGNVSAWGPLIEVPGWFGDHTQGAGVAVRDLTGNGILDIVVFHIDHASGGNRGHYRVGRDLDAAGNPTGGWSRVIEIAGWFGSENADGGIALGDLNGDGAQDMLVFHIDNPSGTNYGYTRAILTLPTV